MTHQHDPAIACFFTLVIFFGACKKDNKEECPVPVTVADGRDQFVGQYHVHDTSGVYLYSMEIMKASDPGGDSLFVVNWGDRFNFYVRHENGDPSHFLNYNPPFPSYDHQGLRWAFSREVDPSFQSNLLVNDTLRMNYLIDNIAFFSTDGVPFYSQIIYEYGVKQ